MRAMVAVSATLFTRGATAFGGILLSLAVARMAGAEGLGRFAVFLGLLGALGILARRGQDALLIRATAWSRAQSGTGTAIALLWLGLWRILLPALALGLVGAGLLATGWLGAPFPGAVPLMPAALSLLVGLSLFAGYAKGLSRAWLAPPFEIGGVSLITALLLVPATVFYPEHPIGAVMGAFLAALVILSLIALLLVWRDTPRLYQIPSLTGRERGELQTGQVAFTVIALATFLGQAGSFVLAAPFLPECDLGMLRASERLALLVSFSVLAINPIIAPRIVQHARGGEDGRLRLLTIRAMSLSAGIGAPVLFALLLWPERALVLMGPEFVAAAGYLQAMALAQFVVAALGPLTMVLNMSGREREFMWISVGVLALSLLLIPVLSASAGSVGFVFAYSGIIAVRYCLIGIAVIYGKGRA